MGMLLAYDAAGNVLATLDSMVAYDAAGNALGLVDFAAHEAAGGALTDVWNVSNATGSGTWPEWLGGQAHAFRVVRSGGRITSLVHKTSGHRRTRAEAEEAVAAILAADLDPGQPPGSAHNTRRALVAAVGSPSRPLSLDAEGRPPRPRNARHGRFCRSWASGAVDAAEGRSYGRRAHLSGRLAGR